MTKNHDAIEAQDNIIDVPDNPYKAMMYNTFSTTFSHCISILMENHRIRHQKEVDALVFLQNFKEHDFYLILLFNQIQHN
jgi:hypothetical protein